MDILLSAPSMFIYVFSVPAALLDATGGKSPWVLTEEFIWRMSLPVGVTEDGTLSITAPEQLRNLGSLPLTRGAFSKTRGAGGAGFLPTIFNIEPILIYLSISMGSHRSPIYSTVIICRP